MVDDIRESRADRVSSFKRRYRRRTKRSERPGARKRVESIRLDDRKKQNEIRGWPKKKQRYGYHDRLPSIKKNLSKSLRISGAFKHPKYAGVVNDIAFLIENDDSFKKRSYSSYFSKISPAPTARRVIYGPSLQCAPP